MQKFIYGKKIGMSQLFDSEGRVIGVTLIKTLKSKILFVKEDKGKASVLIGCDPIKTEKLNKPKRGFFSKYKIGAFKFLKQFTVDNNLKFSSGSSVELGIFKINEEINVRAKSKGHGFSGTIKRHNFSRGPMSHGSKNHRLPGSIGGGTDPGRVFKGTKMGGRLGGKRVTLKGLKVIKIDDQSSILYIKGGIPGKKNNLIEIFN